MPRLEGFIEYRFVPHGWTNPDGHKFTVIDDPERVEAVAFRFQDRLALAEGQLGRCAKHGHTEPGVSCCLFLGDDGWACEHYHRRILEQMRTAERPALVRVEIPA